jgi:hypothetical protein
MESNKTLPEGFKEEEGIVYGIDNNGLMHIKINRP